MTVSDYERNIMNFRLLEVRFSRVFQSLKFFENFQFSGTYRIHKLFEYESYCMIMILGPKLTHFIVDS